MKDTRKKINGLLALAIMGVGFTMAPTMTSALTLPEPSAIAPDALDLTNIFEAASGGTSRIIDEGVGQSVVVTDNSLNQVGAIFSTDDYRIKLTEDYHARFALYFGSSDPSNAGDGMAFVIHSDPKYAKQILAEAKGQRLGVYGKDTVSNKGANAIANSFAIEFDAFANQDYKTADGSNFDYGGDFSKEANHIAHNYPSKPGTYIENSHGGVLGIGATKSVKIIHNNLQSKKFVDNKWHYLDISYELSLNQLTYQFDNLPPVKAITSNADFGGANDLYWGFTGATGQKSLNQKVRFVELPGLVNAKISMSAEVATGDGLGWSDLPNGTVVEPNQRVKHIASLHYTDGKQGWVKPQVQIPLDVNEELVPNTTKYISAGNRDAKISDDDWIVGADGQLTLKTTVPDLNGIKYFTDVTYETRPKNVKTETTVTNTYDVVGKNLIKNLETKPTYKIAANKKPVIRWPDAYKSFEIGRSEVIETYANVSDVDSDSIDVFYRLNSAPYKKFGTVKGKQKEAVKVPFEIKGTDLVEGKNTIQVVATDSLNADSDIDVGTIASNVFLVGKLEMMSIPNFSFGDYTIDQLPQTAKITVDKPLIVSDFREKNQTWKLYAQMKTPFKNEDDHIGFVEGFTYTSPISGATVSDISNNTLIIEGKSGGKEETLTVDQLQDSFKLTIPDGIRSGNYTGIITWTFSETP